MTHKIWKHSLNYFYPAIVLSPAEVFMARPDEFEIKYYFVILPFGRASSLQVYPKVTKGTLVQYN